jgi:hydroxymethylpyrimidine pyrophosphatase-like HAD family hydrolase
MNNKDTKPQSVGVEANKKLGLPFDKMRKITIAFDIDGTLRSNTSDDVLANEDIRSLLRILKKFKNTYIVVWSGSGELYARQVSRELHITHWVNKFASKTDHEVINADIAIDDIQDTAIGKLNLIVREK